MADSFIQVAPDSTGKKVDNSQLTVSAQTVQRQRINVSDPTTDVALATVVNAAPSGNYGLTVWLNTGQFPALVGGKVPVDASGTSLTIGGTVAVTQSGAWTVAATQSGTWTVVNGAGTADIGKIRFSIPTTSALSQSSISVNGSGDNTLVAGVALQTIRVFRLLLVFSGSVGTAFKDGAGTSLSGVMQMTTGGSITLDLSGEPWYVTSAGNAFILNLSAGVQASGTIWYTQS